jgi:CRISPR system Cascade subunit CasB
MIGGSGADANPDRRATAALRRSLSLWPAAPPDAVRVVAPFLPEHATGWRETVLYLIAGLYAMHPCAKSGDTGFVRSFGTALRQAASRDPAQGAERRLLALLACKSEDLPNHLRHAVAYLRSREVPVDYRRLLYDLLWWDAQEGRVQRRWGRDFWSSSREENQQESRKTS